MSPTEISKLQSAKLLEPSEPVRLDTLVAEGRALLAGLPFQPPVREAVLLLGHLLGLGEAQVRARGDVLVPPEMAARYRALLQRRRSGEPTAYLLGRREFFGREFEVDPRVLIPRPETEHLVEVALASSLPPAPLVLDVGTGSGCIAITLACELPTARLIASDLSPAALALAQRNARRLGVAERVRLLGGDLLAPIGRLEELDLVVSNPPYVAPEAAPSLSIEVLDHEPHSALFADASGRAILEALLDLAQGLRPGTPLVLELGHDQEGWIEEAAGSREHLRLESLVRDYAGHPRTASLLRI